MVLRCWRTSVATRDRLLYSMFPETYMETGCSVGRVADGQPVVSNARPAPAIAKTASRPAFRFGTAHYSLGRIGVKPARRRRPTRRPACRCKRLLLSILIGASDDERDGDQNQSGPYRAESLFSAGVLDETGKSHSCSPGYTIAPWGFEPQSSG